MTPTDWQEERDRLEARLDRMERELRELRRAVTRDAAPPRSPAGEDRPDPGDRPGSPRPDGGAGTPGPRTADPREGDPRGPQTRGPTGAGPSRPAPARAPLPGRSSLLENSDSLLARAGVGFLLLAFAFLLKLSIDRGWITPALRLAAAFATGGGLVFFGLRLEEERKRLAQILMGGGTALLYLASYGGTWLYELYPLPVAFALMTTATVLAFVLAERQDASTLALLGLVGGLATPFLLGDGSGRLWIPALYCALVLAGGGAVFVRRGWGAVLAASVVLGGATLIIVSEAGYGRLSLLAWVPFLAVYWAVAVTGPILRPVLSEEPLESNRLRSLRVAAGAALVLAALAVTAYLDLELTGGGLTLLAMSAVLAAGAALAASEPGARGIAADVAAFMAALATVLALRDSTAVFLVGAAVAAYPLLAHRPGLQGLVPTSYLVASLGVAAYLLVGLGVWPGAGGGLPRGAFLRLGFWVLLGVAALHPVSRSARPHLGGAAWVGLLFWSATELSQVNVWGQALVSMAWALQGAVGLILARTRDSEFLQWAGLATLALLAGKLLLVDLSQLDAVLRILIFMGFGGMLVGLGWLVNRPGAPSTASPRSGPGGEPPSGFED